MKHHLFLKNKDFTQRLYTEGVYKCNYITVFLLIISFTHLSPSAAAGGGGRGRRGRWRRCRCGTCPPTPAATASSPGTPAPARTRLSPRRHRRRSFLIRLSKGNEVIRILVTYRSPYFSSCIGLCFVDLLLSGTLRLHLYCYLAWPGAATLPAQPGTAGTRGGRPAAWGSPAAGTGCTRAWRRGAGSSSTPGWWASCSLAPW